MNNLDLELINNCEYFKYIEILNIFVSNKEYSTVILDHFDDHLMFIDSFELHNDNELCSIAEYCRFNNKSRGAYSISKIEHDKILAFFRKNNLDDFYIRLHETETSVNYRVFIPGHLIRLYKGKIISFEKLTG